MIRRIYLHLFWRYRVARAYRFDFWNRGLRTHWGRTVFRSRNLEECVAKRTELNVGHERPLYHVVDRKGRLISAEKARSARA